MRHTRRRFSSFLALVLAMQAVAAGAQPKRINKAIELLEQKQPVYYTYGAGGYEQGKALAKTWADIVLYDLEHAPFDMTALRAFMQGLVDGGPTPSGHRTPAVICTMPVLGLDAETVRANHWMIQQVLATGVHGLHLCRARTPDAIRLYVEHARYPHHRQRVGDGLQVGLRGMGSQRYASKIWDVTERQYLDLADPWPLNPAGEILLGIKIEDPECLQNADSSMRVPGLAFVDWGPRDMGLSHGFLDNRADPPHPPVLQAIMERVLGLCKATGVHFLDNVLPENVERRIDEGVMIGAGGSREAAEKGRRYTKRLMPW